MNALSFEAKRDAFRQSKDGIIVSFVVHPNDLTPELASAPLGTRYVVALAEIGDDEQPKQTQPTEPKSDGEKAVIRAVMLCKDPEFQRWAATELNWPDNEDGARNAILAACDIQSRSELKDNVDARMKLYRLITRFESETGRMAERR